MIKIEKKKIAPAKVLFFHHRKILKTEMQNQSCKRETRNHSQANATFGVKRSSPPPQKTSTESAREKDAYPPLSNEF